MELASTHSITDGVSREELPTKPLPSIHDLLGNSYPLPFQSVSTTALPLKPTIPTPPVSHITNQFIGNSSSSEQVLQFDTSKAGSSQHNNFANNQLEQQEGTSCLPVDSAQQTFFHLPVNYNQSSSIRVKGWNMASQIPPPSRAPGRSEDDDLSLDNVKMSLNVIETISMRTLAFVQHHSAVTRPNQQIISISRPTVFEIDALLGMEKQKEHALSNIRGDLIRLNEQEASAQQEFQVAANMAPGTSQKRQQRHRSNLRCHICNRADTPEWRRGPNGPRTLCNACGLHYAKTSRRMNNSTMLNMHQGSKKNSMESVDNNHSGL